MQEQSRGSQAPALVAQIHHALIRLPAMFTQLVASVIRVPLMAAILASNLVMVPFLLLQLGTSLMGDVARRMDDFVEEGVSDRQTRYVQGVLDGQQHTQRIVKATEQARSPKEDESAKRWDRIAGQNRTAA